MLFFFLLSFALLQGPRVTVDAPPALGAAADRVRGIDHGPLVRTLEASGLPLPADIRILLIAGDDERADGLPRWIVGLAAGTRDIVIFPERIGAYPHDSLDSVVRHEIVHLSLNLQAGGRPLPRWFHEGVATALESGWGTRDEARLLLAALDPPSMADISRLFASAAYPDTSQAYLLSAALVNEIRQRHGRDVQARIAAGVAQGTAFEPAFFAVTGESVDAAADRAWRGHRRVSRWVPVITSPSAVWTLILGLAVVAFLFSVRRRRERRLRWDEEDEADDWPPGD